MIRTKPAPHLDSEVDRFSEKIMPKQQSERVAQAVEHVTFNHGVEGSSPSALTNNIKQLYSIFRKFVSQF